MKRVTRAFMCVLRVVRGKRKGIQRGEETREDTIGLKLQTRINRFTFDSNLKTEKDDQATGQREKARSVLGK